MTKDNGYIPVDPDLVKTIDDIPDDKIVDVDSYSLEDLVGGEIILLGFSTKESEFGKGEYFILEVEHNGELININTGSGAVCRQVEAYQPFFPLRVTVCQTGRKYYLDKS